MMMTENKNIFLVCTSPSFGGLELNTLKLASWLSERGWTITLITGKETDLSKKAAAKFNQVIEIASRSRLGKMLKFRQILKHEKSPLLLTPDNKDLSSLSLYKRFFNRQAKLIYQQQMLIGVNKRDPNHTLRYAMLNGWISPLKYLKEEVLSRTRVPASRIWIIPLGADLEGLARKMIGKKDAREILGLPLNRKIVGVLGRIDPAKGQDTLVKAVAQMKDHPDKAFDLLIMGESTKYYGDGFKHSLVKMAEDSGVAERVHFRSFSEKVEIFYSAIDVFAMSSLSETMGMVTLEAMAFSVPVIGTNRTGTREILEKGALGFLFEPGDPADFCRAWRELLNHPDLQELVTRAKAAIIPTYSKDVMINKLEDLFNKL